MAPSSTRTTSSVTGGSTLTALKLKASTLSMMILPLKELRLMLLQVTRLPMELLLMSMPLELKLLLLQKDMKQFAVEEGSATEGTTGVSPVDLEDVEEGGLEEEVKNKFKEVVK
jgi:hypothetical protein